MNKNADMFGFIQKKLNSNKTNELPVLTLAYIGDAVYELWVRTCLIDKGLVRADVLHKAAVTFVRAKGQAALIKELLPELDEHERAVFYRGRNAKGQYPRHADVLAYRHATGFEALIGYLYISGRQERLADILAKIDKMIEVRDGAFDDFGVNPGVELRDTAVLNPILEDDSIRNDGA